MFNRHMTDNVHQMIKLHLKSYKENNLVAMDGTLGNGYDLAFLNNQEKIGKIYGFDIQEEAIDKCKERLIDTKKEIVYIQDSHVHVKNYANEMLDVIMFNFGYLPGGDKHVVTEAQTSVQAVKEAMGCLKKGGIMTLMTYPGHDEGNKEHEMLNHYLKSLQGEGVVVLKISMENVKKPCPNIFYIIR